MRDAGAGDAKAVGHELCKLMSVTSAGQWVAIPNALPTALATISLDSQACRDLYKDGPPELLSAFDEIVEPLFSHARSAENEDEFIQQADGMPSTPACKTASQNVQSLDVFEEDGFRRNTPSIIDLLAKGVEVWAAHEVDQWKSRHEMAREKYAVLYAFVFHAAHSDPEGFRQICRAKVKADTKNPYLLPVKHFFIMVDRSAKALIQSELGHNGDKLISTVMKEVGKKSNRDLAARIVRWAGECAERPVEPENFEAWFDERGGVTAIVAAHNENFRTGKPRKVRSATVRVTRRPMELIREILASPAVAAGFSGSPGFAELSQWTDEAIASLPADNDPPDHSPDG